MNSFSDIGTLNTSQFSRMASEMTQGQRVMSVMGIAMARVGGAAGANKAQGYNPLGVGQRLDLSV